MKDPTTILKKRYITEKATVLQNLHTKESNRSLARCKTPKYTFLVEETASKPEIAQAVESLYKEKNVKVKKVNTIRVMGRQRRMRRGRLGRMPSFKKAIVTLEAGDLLDNV